MKKPILITSISWIDAKNLPQIAFSDTLNELNPWGMTWPNRVMIGLVGTSNPTPPVEVNDVSVFQSRKQNRALTSFKFEENARVPIHSKTIDPGWTPPIDKAKVPIYVRPALPDDPKFYAGEASSLSGISEGKFHQNTTLKSFVPSNAKIFANALIKFRAGAHTNKIGIEEAKSPVHVPWVWCETLLYSKEGRYRLAGVGSMFPSHAWYVNGNRVELLLQHPVKTSEKEPAISSGRPANQPRSDANSDKETGATDKHEYAIAKSKPFDIDLMKYI